MLRLWSELWGSEEGATTVEYGLMLMLIALAALGSAQLVGLAVAEMWDHTLAAWP